MKRGRTPRRAARILLIALLVASAAGSAGCGGHDRQSAAALYKEYCARCHAPDGTGDPRSLNLYPNLDLTTSAMVRQRNRGAIYSRIASGYGPMPGFSHRLDHEQIESLVDYTLRFQSKAGK
ncbi:MAG TPA: cytochrome c [Thermoanaerobaculia bacterium]|nr:cytochrome c [Thermoanaerobaculia bacterium]